MDSHYGIENRKTYNLDNPGKQNILTPQKSLKILLGKKELNSATINISNKDLFFTEKLIANNIDKSNLKYKLHYQPVDYIEQVIKSRYIPSNNKDIKTNFLDFSYDDITTQINGLDSGVVYKLHAELIESFSSKNFDYILPELVLANSDHILINTKHGLITEDTLKNLNKKYFKKKIFSNSERDTVKAVKSELEYRELESLVNEKEIKSFTMSCRSFGDIEQFVDGKYKYSKGMTEDRKKKILYATNTQLFFDEKMMRNNIHPKDNVFMKNEWYMGPIYAYDHNYKKYK